jgi:hypothetical protein
MSLQETLQEEIKDAQKWLQGEKEESIYKRDLRKRIEIINWVVEEMKNPDIQICALIETRKNELIDEINKKDSLIEADPLDSEVRILDWILYVVCSNEIKKEYYIINRIV